jgi:hypothetical protein
MNRFLVFVSFCASLLFTTNFAFADHVPGHPAPLSAEAAIAATTVKVDGHKYRTGLLPRPEGSKESLKYFSPGLKAMGDLPASYDLRDLGLATPIKNQGNCGSCWAFARTRAFETALIKAGHSPAIDLAEQDALVNDRALMVAVVVLWTALSRPISAQQPKSSALTKAVTG